MAIPTLSGSYIDETYGRLIQTSGSEYADGFGNPIHFSSGPINSVQINKDGTNFTGSSALIFESNALTLTGSLKITGSTIQVGSNTLLGNTLLSGSIIISGSHLASTPTIKIYGDMETNGVIKFLPVKFDIDPTISGSYIFVSGSTDDLYFSQNGEGYSNITRLRWLEGNLYTGLLHGGLITAPVGGTTFNVSSGSGIIVTLNASINQDPYPTIKFVNWGNFISQSINNRTTAIQSYIGIDSNAQIIQQTIPWSDGQYNQSISLGTVIHQNQSTVNASITYPNTAYGYKQRTYDFIKAFGPLKLSGYRLNTSSSLGLTVESGTAFADGRNYQTDPNNPSYINDTGTSVSKIFRYYQSGSTFVQDTNNALGYTGIDTTRFNLNGSGSLVGVSPSKFYVQRIFWYPNSATKGIVAYYGLSPYDTIDEAQARYTNEPFSETPNTQQNAIFLGIIIIKGNANFTSANDYRVVQSSLFRAAGTGGGGGAGGGGATTLSALTDVQLSTLSYGDLLMYDDTHWFNTKTLSGSYTINGSLVVSGSTSIEGNLGVQNSISTTTNTKRFGQIGGGNNYLEVEADSWIATIIDTQQTGIFIHIPNRTYLFGDRVNNNTQILIDDIAQTINMSGSVTFNGNVTSTGGFTGSFAEKMTTTTLGNTDPQDINIISTDITITGAGTYIVNAIYSGIGGVIIFPDPSLYVGQTVRIQNRTNRTANIDTNGNEPIDISSSAITTINPYTTKTFIAGERTTGAYSWMEI